MSAEPCPVCGDTGPVLVVESPYFPGPVCLACVTAADLAAADMSPEDSP